MKTASLCSCTVQSAMRRGEIWNQCQHLLFCSLATSNSCLSYCVRWQESAVSEKQLGIGDVLSGKTREWDSSGISVHIIEILGNQFSKEDYKMDSMLYVLFLPTSNPSLARKWRLCYELICQKFPHFTLPVLPFIGDGTIILNGKLLSSINM